MNIVEIFNQGTAHHRSGQEALAEAAFRRCLEQDPDFVLALNALGLIDAQRGRLFAAEAAFSRALARTPSMDTAANLAAVYQKQGRPEAAFGTLYPYLKRGAHHPIGWNTLGAALMDKGDLKSAAGCFQRAYQQDPRNPAPLVNLHAAVFSDTDLGDAQRCLEQAAAVAPSDPAVCFHLGVIWGLRAAAAAEAHHARLPEAAGAWRESWDFVLTHRDANTRFFGATSETLRFATRMARLEGLIVELGVRFGTTLQMLQSATLQVVHGFDVFTGLPQDWHAVPAGSYSTNGVVPDLGTGHILHAGLFKDTLPPFLAENQGPVRLVHVDCDLYESTVDALELLAPRVQPGTILLFDEYLMNPYWQQDEHRALLDVGRRHGWRWRYAAFSLFSHQAVVQITQA